MKPKLLFILLFISIYAFAQKTIDYKVDSDFTIRIPEHYQDTILKGQPYVFADIEYGRIVIAKNNAESVASFSIKNESELSKMYDEVQIGVFRTTKGKLIGEEFLKFNTLKCKKFSLNFQKEGIEYFAESLLIFFNNTIYSIQVIQTASMAKDLKSQRDEIFSSIQFSKNITPQSQFVSKEKKDSIFTNSEKQGELFGRILIIGVIVFFVMRAVRKKK
jgi:hypothetical protein